MPTKKENALLDKKSADSAEAVIERDTENKTKYSVDVLRKNSIHLFGVTKSTFDGAFFNADNKKYTIKEADSIIKKWLYGEKGGKE